MANSTKTQSALDQVRRRLVIRRVAFMTFVMTLILACVYAGLLLIGRLTGLFPHWFSLWSVAIVPGIAFLTAIFWPGRPDEAMAAAAIDQTHGTKDLFLTVRSLRETDGTYDQLVVRDAERTAQKVDASRVVPFEWGGQSLISAATLGALLLAAWLIPTYDMFGNVAKAEQTETERKLLEVSKKQTEDRKKQLAKIDTEKENSDEVETAVEKLQKDLQRMKAGDRRKNQSRLNKQQKEIGEKFRKLNSGELKSLFDKAKSDQKMGALNDQEMFRKWKKELQEGSSAALEKQAEQIKDDLERLAKEKDPVKRSEMKRQIKKKLKELDDFSSNEVGSKALNAALQRAMQQLESAENGELSEEAMEALKESLDVAQQEMQKLSQSARDLESLEDALRMISMSKKLNAEDQLDGEMFDGEMSLEDYAEMYAQMMGEMQGEGEGDGEGTGGEGFGGSDGVEEDDSITTDFEDKKAKAAIQKGKILFSMKTKGLSDTGAVADADYTKVLGEINQSLDDVIEQEEIPPGYVGGIKKYFDALEKKKAPATPPKTTPEN